MTKNELGKLDTTIIVLIFIICFIGSFTLSAYFPPTRPTTGMCIERFVSPCENQSCGTYRLSIYDHAIHCMEWTRTRDTLSEHETFARCMDKFQKMDDVCTVYADILDYRGGLNV